MCDAILGPIGVHASQKEEFQRQLVEWEPMTLQISSKPNEDDKSRCKQILKTRREWIRTKMYRVQMLRSCYFVSTADGSSLGLHGWDPVSRPWFNHDCVWTCCRIWQAQQLLQQHARLITGAKKHRICHGRKMLKHSWNLTWPIFSLYPSPQEFDETRPLFNYKSTNAQISAFSTERERENSSCTAGVAVIGLSCLSSAVHGGWSTLGKPGPHCSPMMMQSPMKLPGQPKA